MCGRQCNAGGLVSTEEVGEYAQFSIGTILSKGANSVDYLVAWGGRPLMKKQEIVVQHKFFKTSRGQNIDVRGKALQDNIEAYTPK